MKTLYGPDRAVPPYRMDPRNRGMYDNYYELEELSFDRVCQLVSNVPNLTAQLSYGEAPVRLSVSACYVRFRLISGGSKGEFWKNFGADTILICTDHCILDEKEVHADKR